MMIRGGNQRKFLYLVLDHKTNKKFKPRAEKILKDSSWHEIRDFRKASPNETPDVVIRLGEVKELDKLNRSKGIEYYPGTNEPIRFSYTIKNDNTDPIKIIIDPINWEYGGKSGLSKPDYETYVINHEFGHALGYDHSECNAYTAKLGVCPVMYQSTRGCGSFKCGIKYRSADILNSWI